MNTFLVFLGIVFLILCIPVITMLRHTGLSLDNIKAYLRKGGDGEGAIGGITKFVAIVIILGALAAVFAPKAKSYEHEFPWVAYVYGGIQSTNKPSPMCYEQGASNRQTSSGGGGVNFYRYGPVRTDLEYEHHSCAINRDSKSYDAWGVKVTYEFDLRSLF